MPQIPIPFNEQVADGANSSIIVIRNANAEADEPARSRLAGSSTIELILSVTVPNVYPGSMTGARPLARSTFVHSVCHDLAALPTSSSGLGLRTSARYVVRGRVFRSASKP